MSEFFRNGGVAMTPVLLFGALGVAAAVLWLLRAWLFQVARNLCLNRHRSQRRARQALADPTGPPVAPAPADHPERALEDAQAQRMLRVALVKLPVDLAELYQLRTSGLSYEEIASVLAIPIGTVKSRMHAMVSRLREEMQHAL